VRTSGVVSRGILTPILKQGDDLVKIVADSIVRSAENDGYALQDGDIIGITEAVVGRTQGNYATCEQIADQIRGRFGGGSLGVVFPILSRNRFSILLKAMAMAAEKVFVLLSYPSDEMGNELVTLDDVDEKGVNPYSDSFDEAGFRAVFGTRTVHPFTGIDYIAFYKSLSPRIELLFSNDPRLIIKYTGDILCCDIHSRRRTQRLIQAASPGARVLRMDDILNTPTDGCGWSEYGLLGSNKATEDKVKLFPRDTQIIVEAVQSEMKIRTGRHMEVLVYGDGCFKDPACGIWELADPVVAPAYTDGLRGTPNEIKIKYVADNEFASLSGQALTDALRRKIAAKDASLLGEMAAEGTTPRQIRDLAGSLCDLTSGSGDRGTPVVLIQNYFANYATGA
jgi:hypothetical protein